MQQVFVVGANWLQNLQIFLASVFDWIKEWQFIFASLFILLSAGLFVKAISRQIRLEEFKFEDSRRRLGQVYRVCRKTWTQFALIPFGAHRSWLPAMWCSTSRKTANDPASWT
jgi:hypothetical protein